MGSWVKITWPVLLEHGSSSKLQKRGISSTGTAGRVRQHLYSSDCICLAGNGTNLARLVQLKCCNFQRNQKDVTHQPCSAL